MRRFIAWLIIGLISFASIATAQPGISIQSLVPESGYTGPKLTLVASSGEPRVTPRDESHPCSYNAPRRDRTEIYANLTGYRLTILSASLWLGADGGGNIYDLGSSLVRVSDSSVLIFQSWDRYGPSATLSDREYQFGPGVVIEPGDGLVYTVWCLAYGYAGSRAAIATTLRLIVP